MWNYRLLEQCGLLGLVEVEYVNGEPVGFCSFIDLKGFEDIRQIENAVGLIETALFKPVMFIDADGKIKEKE